MSGDQAVSPPVALVPTEKMLTALRQRVLVEADDDDLRDAVRAMLAAIDDFVLVPVEPTEAMMDAAHEVPIACFEGDEICFTTSREATSLYHAMLAARPSEELGVREAPAPEFVLVPVKPTLAMTLAFHDASPHRPTGWTAEDAWAAMLGAAANARSSSARCPSCKGEKWVDDENWSPPYIDIPCDRVPHAGRIPCARCNFSGWNEPDGAIFAQDRRG